MTYYINCRAKITERCLDGKPSGEQFGEDLPMSEDGTWEPMTDLTTIEGTIVCDYCYLRIMPWTPSGRGLNDELEEAIEKYRTVGGAESPAKGL